MFVSYLCLYDLSRIFVARSRAPTPFKNDPLTLFVNPHRTIRKEKVPVNRELGETTIKFQEHTEVAIFWNSWDLSRKCQKKMMQYRWVVIVTV